MEDGTDCVPVYCCLANIPFSMTLGARLNHFWVSWHTSLQTIDGRKYEKVHKQQDLILNTLKKVV